NTIDRSFLYVESARTPMHVGGLAVFDPSGVPFDFVELRAEIGRRLSTARRYRQTVRWTAGNSRNGGRARWVDDPDFDVRHHVRGVTLPAPGSPAQLQDLVATEFARLLDRTRPLWEIVVVDGLSDGGFALVVKTHHAMVDGVGALDIARVLLDPADAAPEDRAPQTPSDRLLIAAVGPAGLTRHGLVRHDLVRNGLILGRRVRQAARATVAGAGLGIVPAPISSLNAPTTAQRRVALARTRLRDYRQVAAGAQCKVNDVVLAVVTAAIRRLLLSRGEKLGPSATVRAMVPIDIRAGAPSELGNQVSAFFVDLPIGRSDPLLMLRRVAASMNRLKAMSQPLGPSMGIGLIGLAPDVLHAAAARTVNNSTPRFFNVAVSNLIGPTVSLYLGDARLREMFPLVPLGDGQSVSVAVASYHGAMAFGINADRAAMPEADRFARWIEQALADLVGAVGGSTGPAPPGRGGPSTTPLPTPL
ncbi:MAG: wax ester/triacylglycerol synthase family O-acyltransferase, partial [Janthinobacterium lividum]